MTDPQSRFAAIARTWPRGVQKEMLARAQFEQEIFAGTGTFDDCTCRHKPDDCLPCYRVQDVIDILTMTLRESKRRRL